MSDRIVVSFRMSGEDVTRLGAKYLERARSLTTRAEAAGATLASWSATTVAFAFDVDSLDEALEVVAEGTSTSEPRWGCGVARGVLEPLADHGGGRADLAWGDALVVAVMLARAARPGEALLDAAFPAIDELVATGKRIARDGERVVRGVRIDPRRPWKKDVAEGAARITTPQLVGDVDLAPLLARPGSVHVVRADPGHGGSRLLAEIAAAVSPGPVLLVTPFGASVEPLGALRRAVTRALAQRPYPNDADLAPVIDMFLGGIGASIEQAASIVAALLRPLEAGAPPGALLLDDAGEIDAESLEACAQVVAWMAAPFHAVARIDATDSLPGPLGPLPRGVEIELPPLDTERGVALAAGVVGGAMDRRAARRVARRAGYVPLAIVEAVALGLARGDLVIDAAGGAALRRRASFAGKPAPVGHWIAKRAKQTKPDERGVLAAVALFGGEAQASSVKAALGLVEAGIAVDDEVAKLVERRWLVATQPGWIALPSRTHRDTIADLLDETPRRVLHHAIAEVLEQSEGELGCAEAAHHAVKAGEGERGARLALRAARAAARAGMSKSGNRLLTLARLADPKCEPLTRQQLLTSLPPPLPPPLPPSSLPPARLMMRDVPELRGPAVPPAPSTSRVIDETPTEQRAAVADSDIPAIFGAASSRAKPDSDGPTLIRTVDDTDRPTRPEAPPAFDAVPHSMSTMAGVAPAPPFVRTPPRAPPAPPSPPPSLPKPMAPPPLRPSVQGMPAVIPPRPGGLVVRPTRSMEAVRPPEAPSQPQPPPPAPRPAPRPPPLPARASVRPPAAADESSMRTIPGASPPPPAVAVAPRPSPSNGDAAVSVATRMVDLAKAALLQGDAAAVERWTEGLRAAGDHDRVASRIDALARLSRGQTGEALRALREAHEGAASMPAVRAQASLAFGLALAAANREQEALLAGLEALARAREGKDPRATEACLAFLSKLYARVDRADEAAQLKAAAIRR